MPNLKIKLTNRTIANLFTGGGVYVIDQWRQIGVETEHIQANDVLYNNALNEGTFDVALSFQGDSVDEPTYQLTRYLSVDLSSNQGKYIDRELDRLFELQKDATDPRSATSLLRAVRDAHADRGLQRAAAVVAAHRHHERQGEGLGDVAQPPDRPGPREGVARAVRPAVRVPYSQPLRLK